MIENNNDEVLILGLPNSGKSTLVNVLTSKKASIIGSTPNTTRDKVSTVAEINNKKIVISDLPGYLEDPDELNKKFQDKLDGYIKQAEVILFVIDVNSKNYKGLDKLNEILRKQNKTIEKSSSPFKSLSNKPFKAFLYVVSCDTGSVKVYTWVDE